MGVHTLKFTLVHVHIHAHVAHSVKLWLLKYSPKSTHGEPDLLPLTLTYSVSIHVQPVHTCTHTCNTMNVCVRVHVRVYRMNMNAYTVPMIVKLK